ncbi:uncharacterized protein LOC121512682 [Cheilinus undulatus]|uniref:uncharacterized protein LOC121512682 n=1 Tax=Cheilinus undulatus TaxID=241271 RepID=UPI001BD453E6|nr:uncharacterized protein LOC121512682 [Cheilinus undulatus]
MMKLTLCAALVWMIFSSVGALKCVNQDFSSLPFSKPCGLPAELCATVAIHNTENDRRLKQTIRMCVPPSVCAAQDEILSVSYGAFTAATSIRCCNTDDCNNDTLTYPDLKLNGLNCSTCADQTVCNTTVECYGNQDHCFKRTVTERGQIIQIHGCASANVCGHHPDWERKFFFQIFYLGNASSNCWKAALRDSALTTRLSLSLFLLALFTLFIS